MKKILLIFTLLLMLLLAVNLYNTLALLDTIETVMMEEIHTAQFPDPVPDVVMNPVVGFPLY